VMPLRVLGVGGGTVFDVAQAIRFAAGLANASGTLPARRADVINLSLTTSGDDAVLRNAVDAATAAGVLVVAAAGNTGRDGFLSPAGFPNVLSVAATDRLGAPARYSSFGPAVGVAAPGGDTHHDRDADGRPDGILSTLLPGRADYALLQGTSMASAHVSGIAALLLGVPGGASATQLRDVLVATADDRGAPGRDDHYGAGLVDAARAVRALAGITPPSEPALVLETSTLRIAADEGGARVPIRNAGGGTLVAAAPTAATDDGIAWLAATVDGSTLRITVDRDPLAPGSHTGRVDLASNGGAATLEVVAEVAGGPPEDLGPVTVVLRDFDSHATVATTTTDAARDYRYRFETVPPGRYAIVATTDRDGNGAICDVGEECGAYPERAEPAPVTVFGGATVAGRDFGLALVLFDSDAPR
jgi:serine protease